MTLFGPPNIGKMKAKHDIKGLIKALTYRKDSVIRINAALALGELKDPDAIDSLFNFLINGDEQLRAASAEALAMNDNSRAIDLLIRGCHIEKSRKVAISALKKIPALATKHLTEQLKDISEGERSAGILQEMGWTPSANKNGAYYWIQLRNYYECAKLGSPGIKILRDYLRSHKNWDAMMALAHVGDPENYTFLLETCGPLYSGNRKEWFHTLAYIKDENTVRTIIRGLNNYFNSYNRDVTLDNEIKTEANKVLRKMGDLGKAYLIEILQERKGGVNSKVIDIVIEALIEMKEIRAFWPLVDIWFDDRFNDIKIKNLENVKRFGEEGIYELCNALRNSDESTRNKSALVLSNLSDTYSIHSLIDDPKSRNSIVDSLINTMTDPKSEIRWCAIKILADIGDSRALPYLIDSLTDNKVSKECSLALRRFGAPAIEPLESALKLEKLCSKAYDILIDLGWEPSNDPELQTISNKIKIERTLNDFKHSYYRSTLNKEWAEKLDNLGWQPGEDMASVCYWIAKGNYEKCCSMGKIAIEPLVIQMIYDKSDRSEILKSLESFGHKIVVEANKKLEEFNKKRVEAIWSAVDRSDEAKGEEAKRYWETHWGQNE